MSTNNFTTRTASLRATKIDTSKITLKGKNILDYISESKTKVLDDRGEFVTDQDLWGTSVTTDENGVVHVSHKWVTNPNTFLSPWNSSVKAVQNNKAYSEITTDAEGNFTGVNESSAVANIQTERIKNGGAMFHGTSLASFSGDLSSLTNGTIMFGSTPLSSFDIDLSNLTVGVNMFQNTSLTSFNVNLSSLVNGKTMFGGTPLSSFNSDLSSLVNGSRMFAGNNLTSFNVNLKSLKYAEGMFSDTALTSFSSDLSSLIYSLDMFANTHKRSYTISHYKMVDGVRTKVTEHFRAEGFTSFSGDLSSLQSGYMMFGDGSDVTDENEEGVTETTKNITPLDEQSVMIIADTIKDLNGFSDWDSSVPSSFRGVIHIGYDSEVCDAAKIEEYCTEIMNKGWTVYLNATLQTTDEGIEGIATLAEDSSITVTPVPYYCKPVEVEQKEANWTDGEKYYIILGAQKVFGDDLSTYGMFTSIENAAMNMGFTPYKYVEEETETVEKINI